MNKGLINKGFAILLFFTCLCLCVNRSLYAQDKETSLKDKEALARTFYNEQQYVKSVALFDEFYWDRPTLTNYMLYINGLMALGEVKKAEKVIKSQIKDKPDDSRFAIDLYLLYKKNNERKKAENQLKKVMDGIPMSEKKVSYTANQFFMKREFEHALSVYDHGRKMFKDPNLFAMDIANVYDIMGRYDLMFEQYVNALTANRALLNSVISRLQSSLRQDADGEKSAYLHTALMNQIRKDPDNQDFLELSCWLMIQERDFETALIYTNSLEMRFDYNGKKLYELGKIAFNNQCYDLAEEAFEGAMKYAGIENQLYQLAKMERISAKYHQIISADTVIPQQQIIDLQQMIDTVKQETGSLQSAVPLYLQGATLKAYYLHDIQSAVAELEEALALPRLAGRQRAEIKILLADILLFDGDHWEATLLLGQVEKEMQNAPLGDEAKYKNALLSYYIGEFEWAQAKFDVLKSSTSKFIANDALYMSLFLMENFQEGESAHAALQGFAKTDLFMLRKEYDKALHLLDSIQISVPDELLRDDIIFRKAEIYQHLKQYEIADSLYTEVYEKYPEELLADNALIKSAQLNLKHLHNREKSMDLFKRIITDYSGSILVSEARTEYIKLRNEISR